MAHKTLTAAAVVMLAAAAGPAAASETITYSYDAKGRLVQAARSGNVNNGVVTAFTFDKADNRIRRKVTGAP